MVEGSPVVLQNIQSVGGEVHLTKDEDGVAVVQGLHQGVLFEHLHRDDFINTPLTQILIRPLKMQNSAQMLTANIKI